MLVTLSRCVLVVQWSVWRGSARLGSPRRVRRCHTCSWRECPVVQPAVAWLRDLWAKLGDQCPAPAGCPGVG